MATSSDIAHTFQWVPKQTSLEVFVRFAIEGYGDENRLYSAVQGRGPDAARELLRYLADLHGKANCASPAQLVIGYEPLLAGQRDPLTTWEGFLAESFEIALIRFDKQPDRSLEFGERLVNVIRAGAGFIDPRLRAWGV